MLSSWPGMNRLYLVTFIPTCHEEDSDQADSPTDLGIAVAITSSAYPARTLRANWLKSFHHSSLTPFHSFHAEVMISRNHPALIRQLRPWHLPDFSFFPTSFSKGWTATWDSSLLVGCLENKAFFLFTPEQWLPVILILKQHQQHPREAATSACHPSSYENVLPALSSSTVSLHPCQASFLWQFKKATSNCVLRYSEWFNCHVHV